jgi:phage-related protein
VVLRVVRRGPAATLLALGTERECLLQEFLNNLAATDRDEFGRIAALLEFTANSGPPRNQEKCRFFREQRVFELKTRGGVRVMAFWDEGNLIICSHAFMKKSRKTPAGELDRARKARNEYFTAKRMNQLTFA